MQIALLFTSMGICNPIMYTPKKKTSKATTRCQISITSVSSVGIATCYGMGGSGIESPWWRVFPHPSRPVLGPPSLLYHEYRVSFPEVKRSGRGVNHPPHLAPRLKKKHSYTAITLRPPGPSCPAVGCISGFSLSFIYIWNFYPRVRRQECGCSTTGIGGTSVREALGTSVTGILRNKCERSSWDKCNWNTEKYTGRNKNDYNKDWQDWAVLELRGLHSGYLNVSKNVMMQKNKLWLGSVVCVVTRV